MVILFDTSINKYDYFLISDINEPKTPVQIVLEIPIKIILGPLLIKNKHFFCDFLIMAKISLQSEKEIRKFTPKKLPRKFQFVLVDDTYNIGKHFKYKESQAHLHNAGVAYKLHCSCGQS